MKIKIEIIGLFIGWFAIIAQFVLMLENRVVGFMETVVRFFSFFTILTNVLVALFFTVRSFKLSRRLFRPFYARGSLTALTSFILIVGLIYQIVLRQVWEPTGLQRIVDELLHTVIPLYLFGYWLKYSTPREFNFGKILIWLLYPSVYIIFVLSRGGPTGYYPYPFLNIPEIGIIKTMFNTLQILLLTLVVMGVLVFMGKRKGINKSENNL